MNPKQKTQPWLVKITGLPEMEENNFLLISDNTKYLLGSHNLAKITTQFFKLDFGPNIVHVIQ